MENREEILTMLAKEWGILPKQPNEFTTTEIAETMEKIGYEGGQTHIQRQVKGCVDAGFIQSRTIKSHGGGGQQKAFSPVDGKTWEDVLQYLKDK